MSIDDNSRLQKTTEHYRRVREHRKRKLDNISRQLEIFIYSSKRSRIWESISVNECRCWKETWNTNQLENVEEKSPKRLSSLIENRSQSWIEKEILTILLDNRKEHWWSRNICDL